MSLIAMFYFVSTIAFADTGTSSSTTAPSIAGSYNCKWNGTLLNNSNFSLSLAKTDDTYNFQWDNDTGTPVMYGTGLTGSDINNLLTSSFWGVSDNTLAGVLSVTVKPDGSLQGSWISQSGKDTGTVECTKS